MLFRSFLQQLMVIAGVFVVALPLYEVFAQSQSNERTVREESTKLERSRGRLSEERETPRRGDRDRPRESDFEWDALTNNSPASGQDPVLGDRHLASYYDFSDSHPYPYYMAKPQ